VRIPKLRFSQYQWGSAVEKIGQDLSGLQRVPLTAAHIAAIRKAGTAMQYAAGTVLVRPGDAVEHFVFVEEGEIEVLNTFTGERLVAAIVYRTPPTRKAALGHMRLLPAVLATLTSLR